MTENKASPYIEVCIVYRTKYRYLSSCPSVCMSVYLPVCLSHCLSVLLCVCLSMYYYNLSRVGSKRHTPGPRLSRRAKPGEEVMLTRHQWANGLVATALDRQRWRTLTQSALSALEEECRHQAQSARERRHLAASIPATKLMRTSSAQTAHGSLSPGSACRATPVPTNKRHR